MKIRSSNRLGNARPSIIVVVVSVIIVLALASILSYQHLPVSQTSITSSSSDGADGTSSESTLSSTTSTETTYITTSTHIFVPCNCSINLDWAWPTYNTLNSLISASEFVVVANVTSALTVGVNASAEAGPGVKGLFPVTGYNITVISVISNLVGGTPGPQIGSNTTIVQIGGTDGGTTTSILGYPSLSVGQSYVLFLTTYGNLFANFYGSVNHGFNYITAGGPQGLFYVKEGKVYSLDNLYPQADAWLPVKASGVPLQQFTSEVQASASSVSSSSTVGSSSSASNTAITTST